MKLHHLPLDILFIILDNLSGNDLANLNLSSRDLRGVAALRLWRTVALSGYEEDGVDRSGNSNGKNDTLGVFDNTTDLVVDGPKKYQPVKRTTLRMAVRGPKEFARLGYLTRPTVLACVETLRVDGTKVGNNRGASDGWFSGWPLLGSPRLGFDQLAKMLARRCTSLRALEYTMKTTGGDGDLKSLERVLDTFSSVAIVRLKIKSLGRDHRALFVTLSRYHITSLNLHLSAKTPLRHELVPLPSTIERLHIAMTSDQSYCDFEDQSLQALLAQCHKLKSLTLEGAFAFTNLRFLPPLVNDLTLKSVLVKDLTLKTEFQFCIKSIQALASHSVTRLELDVPHDSLLPVINCPNLDTLVLRNRDYYMPKHIKSIVAALQKSPGVKNLDCSGIPNDTLCEILEDCKWGLSRLFITVPVDFQPKPDPELERLAKAVTLHSATSLKTLVVQQIDNWTTGNDTNVDIAALVEPIMRDCHRLSKFYITATQDCAALKKYKSQCAKSVFLPVTDDCVINPKAPEYNTEHIRKVNL